MREEYKQFLDNVSAIEAAFKSALTNSDNAPFAHDAELVEKMARVCAFVFAKEDLIFECRQRIEKHGKDENDELPYIESIDNVSEYLQGEYWERATDNAQSVIYEWLEVLDMPNSALRKYKADLRRIRSRSCGWLYCLSHDEKRNYFRRLVSIARGLAPAVKEETKKTDKKSAGKYHDAELNQNAKKYVFNLSPADRSFKCAMIKDRVSLSPKQFEVAKIILCGACDAEGWVSFPSGVRIPSKLKGCADAFFSHVGNDGGGRYRLMGTRQERTKGGKRRGSGAPLKQYA